MSQASLLLDAPVESVSNKRRIDGVDLLRGLVMVLMVLDHTRDYFMNLSFDPTDLSQTTPALFLTRWITHFCAPTFALLAGVGARLAGLRGSDPRALSRFLLTRGIWLIILEETVEKFGLSFRFQLSSLMGIVLWSIGGSFVLLSALVALRTSPKFVGLLGLAIMAGHNLLDAFPLDDVGALRPLITLLLRRGPIQLPGGITFYILYPLLPWFAIIAAGYWLGGLYAGESERRRSVLAALGLLAIGLFAILRVAGVYGDPRPWLRLSDPIANALSFVNCTKYPPSLEFSLMTLGPALLALAAFDRGAGKLGGPLVTFGRVPLFYYLLQWYVIHGLAVLVALARGEPLGWLFVDSFPVLPPPNSTFSLPAVYGWWLVVVVLLYLPCAWFADFKRRHRGWRWLSYL
jgi:uncharacterized membrane protein